ncbi:hypothetical protein KJ657_02685 [Patescibacteria group bacterium]|nr:hypothetical protein [Patescibacteria group bacterium]MBU1015974.1 hypothetical protein [Patescibacteria group bacterium]MBU1684817.1 hypothetical protein [Patescibacteria group bacterium]MBU1938787.1 hypothetical protein [Patescibacteria group bacterium]
MDPNLMWVALGLVTLFVGLWLAKKMIKLALFLGAVAALVFRFHEDLAVAYSTYVTPYIAGSFF